jgi:polar amino acid transport system substrate-binding protein
MMKKKLLYTLIALSVLLTAAGCSDKMPENTVYSVNDLAGADIGVLFGSAASTYASPHGTLHFYDSGEALFDDLKNGALDCAIMDESLAVKLTDKAPKLKILPEPVFEHAFSFMIAKENKDLTEDVNSALAGITESGLLQQIIDGYILETGYQYKSADNTDRSEGTLTLTVASDFPPYEYDGEDGAIIGLDIDVARAVCDLLHVDLEIKTADKDIRLTSVRFGKADMALGGLYLNDADAEIVDFSDPYVTCKQVIVVRK